MDQQRDQIDGLLDEVVRLAALLPTDQRIRALDTAVSRLQAATTDAAADLAADGTLEGSGCRSVGSWVRLYLRRGSSGYRLLRRAELLPALPGFAAAFAAGTVTDEHVDTLLRWVKPCGLEAVQTHETTLVELARAASAKELDQALAALADLARPDRDADKVAALAGRFVTISALGDLVHVDAMVEPALGEALKTGVEAGAALPAGITAADDGRALAQRRADAFGEIITAGLATTSTSTTGEGHPDSSDSGGESSSGGGGGERMWRGHTGRLRAQVALTVALEWLAGVPGAPTPLLAHFGAVPAATAHRLVCDGDLFRVVLDTATGQPLNVGRRHRLALKRQRRALAVIFRRCCFPGCDVPYRFCEIHHRDWWCRDHGGTDLDLLLPFCWTHHHFVHEYGFTVTEETIDGTRRLVHRRPDGHLIPDPDQPLHTAIEQLTLDWPTGKKTADPRPRHEWPPWPDNQPRPPPPHAA